MQMKSSPIESKIFEYTTIIDDNNNTSRSNINNINNDTYSQDDDNNCTDDDEVGNNNNIEIIYSIKEVINRNSNSNNKVDDDDNDDDVVSIGSKSNSTGSCTSSHQSSNTIIITMSQQQYDPPPPHRYQYQQQYSSFLNYNNNNENQNVLIDDIVYVRNNNNNNNELTAVTVIHNEDEINIDTNNNMNNPADCSTILSECFSGEDTAEITTTIIPTIVVPTSPPSTTQQQPRRSDDDVLSTTSTTSFVPSPLRFWNNNNNIQQQQYHHDSDTIYDTTTVTTSTSTTSTPQSPTNSTKLNTKRYKNIVPTTNSIKQATTTTTSTTTSTTTTPTRSSIYNNYNNNDNNIHRIITPLPSPSSMNHHVRTTTIQLDDDEIHEVEEDDEELSWRMCPSKSMSDWTIEVHIIDEKGIQNTSNTSISNTSSSNKSCYIYHVHKSILAVGVRRSQYFVKLFRSNQNNNNGSNSIPNTPTATTPITSLTNTTTTILEMEELTALAFPILLDYMYGTSSSSYNNKNNNSNTILPITTYNATALHVLAQRLDMKHLRTIVRNFWMQDLSMDNIAIYYQHAITYDIYHTIMLQQQQNINKNMNHTGRLVSGGGLDDPLIIRALEMYCAQHLFDIHSGNCTIADILDIIHPQFLYNVIILAMNNNNNNNTNNMDMDNNNNAFSLRLSLIIAVYCNIHYGHDLDITMFYQLTDVNHLPVLECQAAKAFLELQEKLTGQPNTTITALTERCIDVLAKQWDDACIKKQDNNNNNNNNLDTSCVVLPKLEGKALERFVIEALLHAKIQINQYESINTELRQSNINLQDKIVVEQNKIEPLERQNDEFQEQLRAIQKELDDIKQYKNITSKMLSPYEFDTNGKNQNMNQSDIVSHNETVVVDAYDNEHNLENDNDDTISMIEASIQNRTTSGTYHEQHQQRVKAIDHGRLLLQRLEDPPNRRSATTN